MLQHKHTLAAGRTVRVFLQDGQLVCMYTSQQHIHEKRATLRAIAETVFHASNLGLGVQGLSNTQTELFEA